MAKAKVDGFTLLGQDVPTIMPVVTNPAPIIIPEVKVADPVETPNTTNVSDAKKFFDKLTSRKFLIAVMLPIIKVIADKLGFSSYVNTNAGDIIDIIVFAAPLIWMVIEGVLDKERIKQQGTTTVQAIKSSPGSDKSQ